MKFYLVILLAIGVPVALSADKSPVESLNSVYLSQLRLNVRLLDDPIKQCVKYLEGIKNKLEGFGLKGTQPKSKEINIELLTRVGDMLKVRTPSMDNNGLISYTFGCAETLSKYQGDDYIFVNQSSDQQVTTVAPVSCQALDDQRNGKLEEEIKNLRAKADDRMNQIKELESQLRLSGSEFAKYKLSTEKIQVEVKEELKNLKTQLEAERSTYRNDLDKLKQVQRAELEKAYSEANRTRAEFQSLIDENQTSGNQCVHELERQKASTADCLANVAFERMRKEDLEKEGEICTQNLEAMSKKAERDAIQCERELVSAKEDLIGAKNHCESELKQQKAATSDCLANAAFEKMRREDSDKEKATCTQNLKVMSEKSGRDTSQCERELLSVKEDLNGAKDKCESELKQQKAATSDCLANASFERMRREDLQKEGAMCTKNLKVMLEKAERDAIQCERELMSAKEDQDGFKDKCESELKQQKAATSDCLANVAYEKQRREKSEKTNDDYYEKVTELEVQLKNRCQQMMFMNSAYYVPQEDLEECRNQLVASSRNRGGSLQTDEVEELKDDLQKCYEAKEEAEQKISDARSDENLEVYKDLTKDVEEYIREGSHRIECSQWYVDRPTVDYGWVSFNNY